jgi:hypothetical protein
MQLRTTALSALLVALACRPQPATTAPDATAGAADPRDVTRPGDPPPMYRPSSDGPRVAITSNAYGASRFAPNAPQLGDTLPDFELPDARGGTRSLRDERAKGPVVIVFYRGFW